MIRSADRNVKFVRSDDAKLRIAKFPPELMADNDDIQRTSWLAGVLGIEDNARSGQEEDHHDEHRNYRPGKLDLITSVNLRGFTIGIFCALAITDQDVSQHASNGKENGRRNGEYKHRQPKNEMCRSALGRKNTGGSLPEPGRYKKQPAAFLEKGLARPQLHPFLRLAQGRSKIHQKGGPESEFRAPRHADGRGRHGLHSLDQVPQTQS